MQGAFLRLWKRWDRVSAMESPAGWDHDTAPQAVSAQGYPMGHWNYDVWSAT
jgi:hypothetical protein